MGKKNFILFLFLVGGITSCKKESPTNTSGVPNVAVNFSYNIYDPGYSGLQSIGGWAYAGYAGYENNGIILFRISAATILAFDRSCPYDCITNSKAVVQVQTNNITAKCPVCSTTYNLYGGAYTGGPGSIALKQYIVNFDESSGEFQVSN